ncbi:DUF6191 domain-containing protein [Streptomyces sp. NPDC091281]|uniref:DUF6191 domain-containing protein n=1 Tax=Streptomyces sp. NPDC091281 TaxID=3365985 RepID=UPI0038029448
MFNMFDELFAPGRKHTRDEQNRLELTREDVGDGDPGRGPIDLSSGKVVVVRPGSTALPPEPSDATDDRPDTAGGQASDPADRDPADQDRADADPADGEGPRA